MFREPLAFFGEGCRKHVYNAMIAGKSWAVYSGDERYPLSPGVEAIGLDQFLADVLPTL